MLRNFLTPTLATFLLGVAIFHTSAIPSRAGTTVAAFYEYRTFNPEQEVGVFNSPALYDGNFSLQAGAFEKLTASSAMSVTAALGEIHLLNRFSIPAGTFGRFGQSQKMRATIGGGFEDTLTISDASRNGQAGTFTGSIRVDLAYESAGNGDNLFAVGIGSNMADASAASDGVFYDNGGRSTYARVTWDPTPANIARIMTFTVPITFGTPFGIAVWMESTIGTGGFTTEATMRNHDASHTVNWAGTVLVEDAAGNDLAPDSYGLSSGSGVNYAVAVPEPSSAALLAFGLAAFGLRRRQR